MLTANELKRYAHMRRLKILDQIWKDYLQDLILHLIYKKKPNLIFKGGTCIWKTMNGDRFSEDLDFSANTIPKDIAQYLKKELDLLGFSCTIKKEKRTENVLFLKLGISSPVHHRETIILVEILVSPDITLKNTTSTTVYSPYPDIPPVELIVPKKEKIVEDKISTIFERNRPRDIHDLYVLLKQGGLIIKKVNKKEFEQKLYEKKKKWKSLEPLLITKLPSFEQEVRYILSKL